MRSSQAQKPGRQMNMSTHTSNKTAQIYIFSNENDCAALRGNRENTGLSSEGWINRALEHPTTPCVMANCGFLI